MGDDDTRVQAKKSYHHGDLRGQLLTAVRELVEEHGPDGFSIAQACRRAGVSTAAPYKHFSDRTDILRAVALQAMGRLRARMETAINACPAGDPERVMGMGRAYIDFARAEPGVFRLMFGLTEGHDKDPELTAAGDSTNHLVETVVAEHLGAPVDRPDIRLRAYGLWCVVHGHSFLHLDGKHVDTITRPQEDAFLALAGAGILSEAPWKV